MRSGHGIRCKLDGKREVRARHYRCLFGVEIVRLNHNTLDEMGRVNAADNDAGDDEGTDDDDKDRVDPVSGLGVHVFPEPGSVGVHAG